MNFLQVIAIFFNEKKQVHWLNESNSSACIYNLNFINKYKKDNNIQDNLISEEILFAYELPLFLGLSDIICGATYSYFISMFSVELYISAIVFFSIALIISCCSAKINLFKKTHKEIPLEYISLLQKEILRDAISMNKKENIPAKTPTNRL